MRVVSHSSGRCFRDFLRRTSSGGFEVEIRGVRTLHILCALISSTSRMCPGKRRQRGLELFLSYRLVQPEYASLNRRRWSPKDVEQPGRLTLSQSTIPSVNTLFDQPQNKQSKRVISRAKSAARTANTVSNPLLATSTTSAFCEGLPLLTATKTRTDEVAGTSWTETAMIALGFVVWFARNARCETRRFSFSRVKPRRSSALAWRTAAGGWFFSFGPGISSSVCKRAMCSARVWAMMEAMVRRGGCSRLASISCSYSRRKLC